jgi:mRNA-degrading endonuclease toxin of MazEF toxin-antitoxin module
LAPIVDLTRDPLIATGAIGLANVSQIVTIDRSLLADVVGSLSQQQLALILAGIDLVLGR